jgi:hypothetical protein
MVVEIRTGFTGFFQKKTVFGYQIGKKKKNNRIEKNGVPFCILWNLEAFFSPLRRPSPVINNQSDDESSTVEAVLVLNDAALLDQVGDVLNFCSIN